VKFPLHPEFKPGDAVERITPIASHPNSKYDKNKGVVVTVYPGPISGLLVSIDHGGKKPFHKYPLTLWRKVSPNPKTK
jgi:hypothetical protein